MCPGQTQCRPWHLSDTQTHRRCHLLPSLGLPTHQRPPILGLLLPAQREWCHCLPVTTAHKHYSCLCYSLLGIPNIPTHVQETSAANSRIYAYYPYISIPSIYITLACFLLKLSHSTTPCCLLQLAKEQNMFLIATI